MATVSTSFTSATTSANLTTHGRGAVITANSQRIPTLSISGTWVGSIQLEHSLNGTRWIPGKKFNSNFSGTFFNPIRGKSVLSRLNCTAYTSGTIVTAMVG